MTKLKKSSNVKSSKKTMSESRVLKPCPTHRLIALLTGPWTTYILWLIRSNAFQRFGELKKAMPLISAKILTERLRMLEGEGIVSRIQEECIPPKVTYSLTKKGKELNKVLDEINHLAKKWYAGNAKKNSKKVSKTKSKKTIKKIR